MTTILIQIPVRIVTDGPEGTAYEAINAIPAPSCPPTASIETYTLRTYTVAAKIASDMIEIRSNNPTEWLVYTAKPPNDMHTEYVVKTLGGDMLCQKYTRSNVPAGTIVIPATVLAITTSHVSAWTEGDTRTEIHRHKEHVGTCPDVRVGGGGGVGVGDKMDYWVRYIKPCV